MKVQTPTTPEEQDKAYNPSAIHAAEQFSGANSADASDTTNGQLHAGGHTSSADQSRPTENIDNANQQEKQKPLTSGALNRGWLNNYTGANGEKVTGGKKLQFKKGPTGLIIGTLVGGGGLIGGLTGIQAGIVHIKEVLLGKVDTFTSINETRAYIGLKTRMFSTNATCKIKVRCRFSGLSDKQMTRLKESGAQLLDKDGKEVKPRTFKVGSKEYKRYAGGHTLVIPDTNGTGQVHKITASNYKKALRTVPELRDTMAKVHPPRAMFLAFGEKIKFIRKKFKLTTDQKWGAEGNEKEARKAMYESQTGQDTSGAAETQDNAKYGDDGKPIDKDGTHIAGLEGTTDQMQERAEEVQKIASEGGALEPLPSDPASVAMMDDPPASNSFKSVFNKTLGALSPVGMVAGICTVYQIAYMMVLSAKTIVMVHAMRYAASILSTIDKIKYGAANSDAVQKLMAIFQKVNEFGQDFGAAVGYQFPAYGTVPGMGMTFTAMGNETIRMLTAVLDYVDSTVPGGGTFVRTTCKILTNPFLQGGLALASFIPGAGQAAKSVASLAVKGAKVVAEKRVKAEIQKIIAKKAAQASAASIATVAKGVTQNLWRMAKSPYGIFLAAILVQKYGVEWGARTLAGAEFTNLNGPEAIDVTMNGTHAIINAAATESGGVPLTKDQYKTVFKPFNDSVQATRIADARAKSNPFDIYDPYSASNALASSFYTFSSQFNLKNNTANLLSIPATILSNLNPSNILSKTASADDVDVDSTFCKDDTFLDKHKLASMPDCQVVVAYPDTDMLRDEDGKTSDKQVRDWMEASNQIIKTDSDQYGEPLPGSDYADFHAKCVVDSSGKVIGNVGEESQQLDPECYGPKNNTYEWKMFRLYEIDSNIANNMDNVELNNTDTPTTPTTDPTEDAYVPHIQEEKNVASTIKPPVVTIPPTACDNGEEANDLTAFNVYGAMPALNGSYMKKMEVNYAA